MSVGWSDGRPLEPIPYHWQREPERWRQVLSWLLLRGPWRGLRCATRWCGWAATEEGWYCDRHDPNRESYGVTPESMPADPFA